jgi:signal transduction histidine kinase
MTRESILLTRRRLERRRVVLAAAALGFAAIAVAGFAGSAVDALYVLPVTLAALELGLAGGLAAAGPAIALAIAGDADGVAVASEAVAVVAAGAIAGRFSDRMRAGHTRAQRLLDSGLAIGRTRAPDQLARAVAAAALRSPGAAGAIVELAGAPACLTGRTDGHRTVTEIAARGDRLGRIVLRHRGALEADDRAALVLLAVQAGLAADNLRLHVQRRDAAVLEAELRRARDDLLEQRSGLGRVLDAQEHDRRRVAETLHEELAQVLAAVLLGLRMLRREAPNGRGDSLDELYGQVVGVLDDVRALAGELRPSSLAHLGLVPALEADGIAVDADRLPEPLPEPLRTGAYRLIEHAVSAVRPGGRASVRLTGSEDAVDAVLDLDLERPAEVVAAARAQAALMSGTLREERSSTGGTRLRVRLPQDARTAGATGSVARTTVRPGPDSMSS